MRSSSPKNRTVTIVAVVVVTALVALFLCLCCCGIGAAVGSYWLVEQVDIPLEPTPSPRDFLSGAPGTDESAMDLSLLRRIADTPTGNTDYWLLYGQLKSETGDPAVRAPVQGPTEHQVGDVHTFWMGDEEEQRYWQIDAELHIKTECAYFYIDTETSFDIDKLREAAELFDSQICPANRRVFGSEWSPGIDHDPRVTILVTHQMPSGIAGYFSTSDEYPGSMKPRSNEREMIYVTSSYLSSLDMFGQLLSHEFQHMIHWNQDQSEATWVNEGFSLLAEEVNGYEGVLGGWLYWRNPDMQLTNWAEDSGDRLRNYAASKLFLSYLGEHYGGYEVMSKLIADDVYGVDGINRFLRSEGYNVDFEAVFANWVVANLIDDKDLDDGQYGYALRGSNEPKFSATLKTGAEHAGWVRQFGADYIKIDAKAGTELSFQGANRVRLAGQAPHGGKFAWWSNRRNMLSSSITRRVDLEGVKEAALHFWTWYDIEEHFDYAYVAVSVDGGRTWETLPGTHTTSQNPNQSNYGHGYTGKSGVWQRERVVLSAYVGQQILLRFWYITDPGLNQPGWLIDDISIPETGFVDDGEQEDHGWTADGFVRSSNYVPQAYVVQLVEYGPQMTVRRLDLGNENKVSITLADQTRRAVLIVSGATRWTSEPAPYRVEVR